MDMPGTGRAGNDESQYSRWFGTILSILFGYLQLISQQQCLQGEGGAAARFDSLIAPSLCLTIALIVLTASMPFPPSKGLKICIFLLILGCVILLSSALPKMVCWLPYLSCIHPLFHLLPPRVQCGILNFSKILREAITRCVDSLFHMLPGPFQRQILQFSKSSWNVVKGLVPVNASPGAQSSPPAQANINLDIVEEPQANINLDIVEFLHDGSTNIASTTLAPEDINSI